LDGDLYESTKCCLDYLYDNVVTGGVVLIDDWWMGGVRQAVTDFFAENECAFSMPEEMPVTVDTGACYWLKP
jgi:O-methyltransferase